MKRRKQQKPPKVANPSVTSSPANAIPVDDGRVANRPLIHAVEIVQTVDALRYSYEVSFINENGDKIILGRSAWPR